MTPKTVFDCEFSFQILEDDGSNSGRIGSIVNTFDNWEEIEELLRMRALWPEDSLLELVQITGKVLFDGKDKLIVLNGYKVQK